MVLLRCESFWEKSLIPAFVFFFQKLYPFPWANDPGKKLAAAAGGCILIRWEALNKIGGLCTIRETLIDDCSLAAAVKSSKPGNKIWLGLTEKNRKFASLSFFSFNLEPGGSNCFYSVELFVDFAAINHYGDG